MPTYWLPTIRSLGVNVPVVLIGNKIDLREGQVTNQALEDGASAPSASLARTTQCRRRTRADSFACTPARRDRPYHAGVQGGRGASASLARSKLSVRRAAADPNLDPQTCVECSALLPLNVSEVFFFAQNAVLHPTAPLYDTRQHVLKPACVAALSRIFRLVDADKDGLLSPDELNDFQRLVFDAPLQARELEGVKEVVEQMTDGSGVENGGLNEEGWLALHTYFVQKGRLETTWKALRCFGYGEDLMLRDAFLFPRCVGSLDLGSLFSPLPASPT